MAANSGFKATIGVGNILGLFFGTFLYMADGYKLPFITYGLLYCIVAPLTCYFLPSAVSREVHTSHQVVSQDVAASPE